MNRRITPLILSFIYCGLGQIYNRQVAKGIDFIVVYTILAASYFAPMPLVRLIGLSILPTMWFIGMVDAYLGADAVVHKKGWLLGVLPGVILSLLAFYILFTSLPPPEVPELNQQEDLSEISGAFSVQVYFRPDLARAKALNRKLLHRRYSARIERSSIGEEQWFRVLTGSFDTAEDAALFMKKLREEEGITDAVVYKNTIKEEKPQKPQAEN